MSERGITMEKLIRIKLAIEQARKKYGYASELAIRQAVRENKIPHFRTSDKKRAQILLKLSDLFNYLDSLAR